MDYSTVADFCISFSDYETVEGALEKVSELKQLFIDRYETFNFQLLIKENEVEGKDCGPYFDEFMNYIKNNVTMDEDGNVTIPSPNPYDYPDRAELDLVAYDGDGDMEFLESFSFNDESIRIFVNAPGWFVSELENGFSSYTDISHMMIDWEGTYKEF
jgi:hypothetical protein